MAGTIVINDHADWLPAGWVHDNVLEAVATELRQHDAALADDCLAARTTQSHGYFDMRGLDAETYRRFLSAAEQALATIQLAGPDAVTRRDFYPGYVAQFQRFCELLRSDPRATVDGAVSAARHAHGA
ncbi:MAG TPA: hypothetical protein VNH11_35480 [Pirellulales bacterium]|nr:hypothetical protein [Pirellulales bacterium]